ncbi:MAG TPA: hypothetical protein VF379_03215 [Gaiellaceae bacterium]|jgi:hypothetical protein
MATRKQRRRRDKDFRHDVRVFEIDAEGNEVPIAELRTHEEKQKPAPAKKGKQRQQARGARARTVRDVPPPSWDRAFKRGGLMGLLMLVAFLFLFKNAPIGLRLAWGLFYALAFIPLTYWIDRTAHRSFLKRVAKAAEKKS